MSLTSTHNYNTRSSNDATNRTNFTTVSSESDTATLDPLANLESKLLARFDAVQSELLNVKNIIIKNLREENERLREKVSQLDKKIISLESRHNMLEQYGRRNNLEIKGIPNSVPQKDLESKVVNILSAIGVNVSKDDFEDCHRIGKSRDNSKKTIVRFTNRKIVKDALYKRKQLKNIDKAALEMQNAMLFLNENLSEENNKIAFLCRKLKREGVITNTYTANGIVRLSCVSIKNGRIQKVPHISYLFENFPDFDFGLENNENDDESEVADVSLQSSY